MKFLHSGSASNVDSHVVRELCKLLGIGKTKSLRLHLQGDGISGLMVKVLKSCIQKQVDSTGTGTFVPLCMLLEPVLILVQALHPHR